MTFYGEIKTCSGDSQCELGKSCFSFFCAPNRDSVNTGQLEALFLYRNGRAIGIPCLSHKNCLSGFCSNITGLCTEPTKLGDHCASECKEGKCDRERGYCLPPEMTPAMHPELHCFGKVCKDTEYCEQYTRMCRPRLGSSIDCYCDAECLDGMLCYKGECTQTCLAFIDSSLQCRADKVCVPLISLGLRPNNLQGLCINDSDFSASKTLVKPLKDFRYTDYEITKLTLEKENLYLHSMPSTESIDSVNTTDKSLEVWRKNQRALSKMKREALEAKERRKREAEERIRKEKEMREAAERERKEKEMGEVVERKSKEREMREAEERRKKVAERTTLLRTRQQDFDRVKQSSRLCLQDSECRQGEKCFNFVCARDKDSVDLCIAKNFYDAAEFLPIGYPCIEHSRCMSGFCSPTTGLCSDPQAIGDPCFLHCREGDCDFSLGYCLPPELPSELLCDNKVCSSNQFCNSGECQRRSVLSRCTLDSNCPDGLTCYNGLCSNTCLTFFNSDDFCLFGETCVSKYLLGRSGNLIQGICIQDYDFPQGITIRPVSEFYTLDQKIEAVRKVRESLAVHSEANAESIERASQLDSSLEAFRLARRAEAIATKAEQRRLEQQKELARLQEEQQKKLARLQEEQQKKLAKLQEEQQSEARRLAEKKKREYEAQGKAAKENADRKAEELRLQQLEKDRREREDREEAERNVLRTFAENQFKREQEEQVERNRIQRLQVQREKAFRQNTGIALLVLFVVAGILAAVIWKWKRNDDKVDGEVGNFEARPAEASETPAEAPPSFDQVMNPEALPPSFDELYGSKRSGK